MKSISTIELALHVSQFDFIFFAFLIFLFLAPCMNGGHCRSNAGNFRCECQTGFTGDRCQTNIDECASRPCENNATCVDGIGKFTCNCLPGKTF